MADQQKGRGIAAGVIAVVAAGCGLYLAREVFIPIAVSLLLYALLRPLVRRLSRAHVPSAVSATVIVLGLIALLAGVGVAFAQPLGDWVQKAPETFQRARSKFTKVTAKLPFGASLVGGESPSGGQGGASGRTDEAGGGGKQGASDSSTGAGKSDESRSSAGTGGGATGAGSTGAGGANGPNASGQPNGGGAATSSADGASKSDPPQSRAAGSASGSEGGAKSGSAESGGDGSDMPNGGPPKASEAGSSGGGASGLSGAGAVVAKIFGTTASLVSTVVEVLLLLLFLLAMGDRARSKVMRAIDCYDDRRTAVTVAEEIESVVSRYVVATACINLAQGVAVGITMWLLGLPTPALWGMLTFVFEFIPYLGALVMMLLLAVAGLTSQSGFAHAMLAPGLYLVITTLQNNLVSPIAYGSRLKLSPAAILVAVMVGWFLWGFAGAFVAVPVLAAVKVLADHVKALKPIRELIGD